MDAPGERSDVRRCLEEPASPLNNGLGFPSVERAQNPRAKERCTIASYSPFDQRRRIEQIAPGTYLR